MEHRGIGFPRSTDDLDACRRFALGIRTMEGWNGVVWRRESNIISRPFVKRLFLVWCEYHATTPRYARCGFHLSAPIFLGSGGPGVSAFIPLRCRDSAVYVPSRYCASSTHVACLLDRWCGRRMQVSRREPLQLKQELVLPLLDFFTDEL